MGARIGVALLLLAAAAAGESREEVRAFVERFRSQKARDAAPVVVPDVALPAVHGVRVEYVQGHHVTEYVLLRFTEEGDLVRVLRSTYVTYLQDVGLPPFTKAGLSVEEARITRADFDDFAHRLLLLGSARIEGEPEGECRDSGGSIHVEVGTSLRREVPLAHPRRANASLDRLDQGGRGLLWFRHAAERQRGWKFGAAAEAEVVAGDMLADLLEVQGWRRDLRVLNLGWLGHEPALEKLSKLDRKEPLVDVAMRQIELIVQCRDSPTPPPIFQKLLNWSYPGLSEWAHEQLRRRYPAAYKDELCGLFGSPKPADRLRALEEMERLDPEDLSLARRALADPAAEVRVEAARLARDNDVLLRIARGAKQGEEARCAAIIYLTWEFPPSAEAKTVGPALIAVARDGKSETRVRCQAVVGLGYHGYQDAIPALLGLLARRAAPEDPFYDLVAHAAEALGYLRAQEAVEPLVKLFEAPPRTYEHRRQEIGNALARLGDPRGIAALERALAAAEDGAERGWWQSAITHAQAIRARDAKALLGESLGGGCPGYTVRLLADLFDHGELRSLLDAPWLEAGDRSLVTRAIAVRERR